MPKIESSEPMRSFTSRVTMAVFPLTSTSGGTKDLKVYLLTIKNPACDLNMEDSVRDYANIFKNRNCLRNVGWFNHGQERGMFCISS